MTKKERQELWETRLAEYRASGQSVTAWCKEHNVNPQQLWYWRRKEKQQVVEENAVSWLPVDLSEIKSQSSLLVRIGRATIEVNPGFDPELLLDVVNILVTQ